MGKLRPLTELREESSLGDLIKFVCEGTSEKVGYYQAFIQKQDVAIFSKGKIIEPRNSEHFFVDISTGVISDQYGDYGKSSPKGIKLRALQYEVLRKGIKSKSL